MSDQAQAEEAITAIARQLGRTIPPELLHAAGGMLLGILDAVTGSAGKRSARAARAAAARIDSNAKALAELSK